LGKLFESDIATQSFVENTTRSHAPWKGGTPSPPVFFSWLSLTARFASFLAYLPKIKHLSKQKFQSRFVILLRYGPSKSKFRFEGGKQRYLGNSIYFQRSFSRLDAYTGMKVKGLAHLQNITDHLLFTSLGIISVNNPFRSRKDSRRACSRFLLIALDIL
jgi:hypothetical protein